MSAIDDKHAQLPWIGNPKDEGAGADEGPLPDGRGRVRDYDNGSIYWSAETGAHEVHGAIRDKYGQTRKWIGYPTTDETGCPTEWGASTTSSMARSTGRLRRAPTRCTARSATSGSRWAGSGASSATRRPTSRTSRAAARSTFQGGEIQWTQTGGPVVHKSQRLDD